MARDLEITNFNFNMPIAKARLILRSYMTKGYLQKGEKLAGGMHSDCFS